MSRNRYAVILLVVLALTLWLAVREPHHGHPLQ